MNRAACYLRSSKDRHDVSIEAQRDALKQMASQRGLAIVDEFVDVVESGKDDDRPGFLRLVEAVRNERRGWTTLLVLDTSRLARRRLIAILFEEHECARAGVKVIYKTLPEAMDPAMEVVLKSQLQAMDEWHSISSRQKGLAGMSQNVRAGFRAGGRAPFGYQLERVPTGAIREGLPVTKSRLVPDENAAAITTYLKARAAGVPRSQAARDSGITLSKSSLVGVEWNALTYAGHTVWNVHMRRQGAKSANGHRRRPRSEWQIQRNTHEAFITEAEAEAIVARLQAYGANRPRRSSGKYLFTGLLRTPAGERYYGTSAADSYRVTGRYVKRAPLEHAVLGKIMADLDAPAFISAVVAAAHRTEATTEQHRRGQALKERVSELTGRIAKMMDMAGDLADPGPALRRVDDLERERQAALAALDQWEAAQAQCAALSTVRPADVRRALHGMVRGLRESERDAVKTAIVALVERIDLDPQTLACSIHYRISVSQGGRGLHGSIKDAYPWGRHLNTAAGAGPVVRLVMPLILGLGRTRPKRRRSRPPARARGTP